MDSPLISEFLKDHQLFSRLLLEISKLLEQGKIEDARKRARGLGILAGPHIAYEESELYPRLAELGEEMATEAALVDQHHEALDAVKLLAGRRLLSELEVDAIKTGIQDAISHAEHCGTLISLLTQLDDDQQNESLAILKRLRVEGKKWTEL